MEENYENKDAIENIQPSVNNTSKEFKYHGQNGDFLILYFKNILLTIITLGLYYPWAKVEILKYHYQNTQLEDSRFQFTGTGQEVFKGFIKIYIFIIALYALLGFASASQNVTLIMVGGLVFYVTLLCLIPLAIHGAMRYRSSRTVYSGIHFKYLGERMVFFKLFFKELLFTILTFGIYGAWMQVNLRKYILDKLNYGNVKFKFDAKGGELFVLMLIGQILTMFTFGIYFFWFQKDLIKFNVDNTKLVQDGVESSLDIDISGGDVFKLLFINILIVVFTFGLGAPIATIRTMNFIFENMKIKGALDLNNVAQGDTDDYDDASGDDFLDFLDFDLL